MRSLRLLVPFMAGLLALSGCGGSDDVSVLSGRFVGETSTSGVFLAILASPPSGSGSSRLVRAYVSDGSAINEFFTGNVNGNFVELDSEDGDSHLSGLAFSGRMSGTVMLSGSQTVDFDIAPATGFAGLYDVSIGVGDPDTVAGSFGSLQLTGLVTATVQDSRNVIQGQIEGTNFEALATPDVTGEHRWIVLSDGRIAGGFKQGHGVGFVSPAD